MFRAISCSSSGGQIVLIQYLVSSLSVSDRLIHRLRKNLSTGQSLTDSDDTRCCIDTIKPTEDEQRAARNMQRILTHCGRVAQICVFNTVKLGTSASSPQCHSTRGNVSRGITPSSTTRVFGEYFLKISVHKNSQRICYTFLKKHSIKVD